jgi:hypothetical protein
LNISAITFHDSTQRSTHAASHNQQPLNINERTLQADNCQPETRYRVDPPPPRYVAIRGLAAIRN